MTTRRRALAVLAAGAMLSPVLVTGSAAADGPGDSTPPEQQRLTDLCENVLQTEPFADIEGGTFERAIECLAAARITQGGPAGLPAEQFGPGMVVTRASMASFVARLLDTAAALSLDDSVQALPAYDGSPAFTDVLPGTHFEAVNRLQQAGIVQGGVGGAPATTYSPQLPVNRAQMASFLARSFAFATGSDPLQTANDYYTDDEDQTPHEGNINVITSFGIAVGDGRNSYTPRAAVQRGQMAAFLTRTMAVMEARGLIEAVRPNSDRLQALITEGAAYRHLEAFQQIATRNEDTRASGLPGYEQSREYIASQLRGAGYEVTEQPFEFPFFRELEAAELSTGTTEFTTSTFTYSGSGDVTGTVTDVDPDLGAESTAGCEEADFDGFTEGHIALIRRGGCTFGIKATNAAEAGASAVIIYNAGGEGFLEPFAGTLGGPGLTIPAVSASFDDGRAIAAAGTATVFASTESETRTTHNVIAQTVRGDQDNVVMLGAHLDSVVEGPGINDNGTGSAAILEVALQAAKEKPTNALRFAWWGAEELGLLGSEYYVENLSQVERDRIALYLNFDMIGSPNFARFVYDGDDSAEEDAGPGPQGSASIEYLFSDYFESLGLPSEPTDFSGRSDYGPFIAEEVGIPAGGLFTGAEGIKTPRQVELYGGTAGEAYDPNYHEAGDTIANVNRVAFKENLGAIVHAVAAFGASTTGTYDLGAPDRTTGPGTSAGESSQGGLHEDHDHEQDAA